MPRKRTHDEMVASEPNPDSHEQSALVKLRNMWEFANVHEYISIFGKAVKVEQMDIEDFETECLSHLPSQKLEEIGLSLLKYISSHRDLDLKNWDEYVRRQYRSKLPDRTHPYGDEDEPKKFRHMNVYVKLRVLQQLTVWTFWNPDRLRQSMPEQKDTEQFDEWIMHPYGWDRGEREYFLLSDTRLYRRTDPPIPAADTKKQKYTSKKAAAQRKRERASKRRRVVDSSDAETETNDMDETLDDTQIDTENQVLDPYNDTNPLKVDTLGGYKWECVAVSLDEYKALCNSLQKTKDENEKNLRARIEEEIVPELHAQYERRQRKIEARERELMLQQKMLGAKRSGRLAAKQEREREEAEAAEVEKQRQTLLAAARREEERQNQMENDRQTRMMTREQRIRDREMKRVLMEEQIARDAEEQQRIEEEGSRGSRHLKDRIEKNMKELEEFEDEEWTFDCSGCGQYGKNFDDGEHSIACERCNVWQHSKCLGFSKASAEKEDFHFVCKDCRRKEERANQPKISLKFKVGQSSSPPQPKSSPQLDVPKARTVEVLVPAVTDATRPSISGSAINGQFRPFNPAPAKQPQHFQPIAPLLAPSMPQHPAQSSERPAVHPNGTASPYANTVNGYAQQSGAPNTSQSQNISYQHYAYPPPQHQSTPQTTRPIDQTSMESTTRTGSNQINTPRPASSHSHVNGFSPAIRQRIPSPIVNRPTFSPTQGNPDVGPIAGVPGSSPLNQPASRTTSFGNGHYGSNGFVHSTPNQQAHSQNSSFSASQPSVTQPMSGLSPTKQRQSASPVPAPSTIPQKSNNFTTPSSSFNYQSGRTVSGTPIFPPAENLAPSPQQLNREPVPTPSKQSPPLPSIENGHGAERSSFIDDDDVVETMESERLSREDAVRKAQMHIAASGTVQ